MVPQVADFPAQDGLGQKMRHERTVPIEVFTEVAEEDDVALLANERGHLPPTARAGNVVVDQRNRGPQAQVVSELDYPVPKRDVISTISPHLTSNVVPEKV
jgi:hypothetical protein